VPAAKDSSNVLLVQVPAPSGTEDVTGSEVAQRNLELCEGSLTNFRVQELVAGSETPDSGRIVGYSQVGREPDSSSATWTHSPVTALFKRRSGK
jgi:hypothetical protein